jgi:hypothetical protein
MEQEVENLTAEDIIPAKRAGKISAPTGGEGVEELSLQDIVPAKAKTAPTFYNDEGKIVLPEVDKEATLMKDDLLREEYLPTLREYMVRVKGEQYTEAQPEEVVDDFVTHMRNFNTNILSTAALANFVSKADDEDKAVVGRAYEIYDQLGNVFVNDGVYGAVTGVKDYIFAAATDPTNYLGLLTGGLAKGAAFGVGEGGKAAVRLAASNAAKKAALSSTTRKAADVAGRQAAASMSAKLVAQNATKSAATEAAEAAYRETVKEFMKAAGVKGVSEFRGTLTRQAARNGLMATTAMDSLFAVAQDALLQDTLLDVGAQEQYSGLQTAASALLGGIGGGLHLAFGKMRGVSGYEQAQTQMALSELATSKELALSKYSIYSKPNVVQKGKQAINIALDKWAEKVARGDKITDLVVAPEEIISDIFLGPDGKSGLVKVLNEEGIRVSKNTRITDALTSLMHMLSPQELADVTKKFENATGISIGAIAGTPASLGDVIASMESRAGRVLSIASLARRKLDAGVVVGNETLAAATKTEAERTAAKEVTAAPFSYAQQVWRRLLVSAPQTTAANVFGFVQFYGAQTIADMLNSGIYGALSVVTPGKRGQEFGRLSKVYRSVQAQKFKNLLDPFTTHDVYMSTIAQNKDVERLLFETVTGGVERTAKRYGIDEANTTFKVVERITNAANRISGVRAQDTFTKSQMFISEVDKWLRIDKNKTFAEVLQSGDMGALDEDIMVKALDTTLKSVFSKDYTTQDQMFNGVAKLVENISNTPVLGFVLPFGRFMNNIVATAYQWSPIGYAGVIANMRNPSTNLMENFARATVGTATLVAAAYHAEERQNSGLSWKELDVGGGTVVDISTMWPYSMFAVAGEYANYMRKGEPVPQDIREELLKQAAIGQAAGDLQFGNDLTAAIAYIEQIAQNPTDVNTLEGLFAVSGNALAGVTRPLDPINRLVGYLADNDIARDLRQARGTDVLTQRSTRYIDNIIEAMFPGTSAVTGVEARVATREGELYDAAPMTTMMGIRTKQPRTATERVLAMADMEPWRQNVRTGVPEYDRIANQVIAPLVERRMKLLMDNQKFIAMSREEKRRTIEDVISDVKETTSTYIRSSGGQNTLEAMRLQVSKLNKSDVAAARDELSKQGYKLPSDPRDMNFKEMLLLKDYIEYFNSR